MTREDMTPEAYEELLESITDILLRNGLKATTMDSIAASLQMSKRTLYEIFDNKSQMVSEALKSMHNQLCMKYKTTLENSANIMEAILTGFLHHRDLMSKVHVDFFKDMDSQFADARTNTNESKNLFLESLVTLMHKGVEEGYFRDDINYMVQCKMMIIQMESLKRMEELFPPDITLLEVYDSICIVFLRGICSQKGIEILDNLLKETSILQE